MQAVTSGRSHAVEPAMQFPRQVCASSQESRLGQGYWFRVREVVIRLAMSRFDGDHPATVCRARSKTASKLIR